MTLPGSTCDNSSSSSSSNAPYEHLTLELWAPENVGSSSGAEHLVGSCTTLLLPPGHQAAVDELHGWLCEDGGEEGAHAFIGDLAAWMECGGGMAQQQHSVAGDGVPETCGASEGQLEMAEVGQALFAHSTACDMSAVAGKACCPTFCFVFMPDKAVRCACMLLCLLRLQGCVCVRGLCRGSFVTSFAN